MEDQSQSEIRTPPWQPGTRIIASSVMLILTSIVLYQLRSLLVPVLLALLLSYILHPLVGWISRRLHWARSRTVLLVYILLILIIAGSTTGVGFALSQQLGGMVQDLITLSYELPRQLEQLAQSTLTIGPFSFDLSNANLEPLLASIADSIRPILAQTGALLASLASVTASVVSVLLAALVLGYYLLLDFEELERYVLQICPPAYRVDLERLLGETSSVWASFLRGQLILGLIVGSGVALSLTVLGVRFSLVLGLISGLMEFVPIFGPFISGGVAVLVAFFQGSNWWGLSPWIFALIVAGLFILIQQIENNILVPRIIGRSLNLKPLVVLLAVFAGGTLAGILGILLASPVFATLRIWLGYVYSKAVGLEAWPDSGLALTREKKGGSRLGRVIRWGKWPWSGGAEGERPAE
jgi:predicted PurR-regulated permease PerM